MHLLAIASLKNRALIALVTIVAAVFGGLALGSLKQELIPSVSFPQLAVLTTYQGASPEVVDQSVSVPIEQAIQGVAGLETTSTTSSAGRSVVSASFAYGTDLPSTENKISQAVNRIRSALPEGVDPQVLSGSIDDFPVIQIAVTGGEDERALANDVRRLVTPALEDLDGVRAADVSGVPGQRVVVTPDPAALAARGIPGTAIRDAVQSSGVLVPAGTLTEDGRTLSVQAGTQLGSVDDIAALPLVGGAATVGDVAAVELTDDPVTTLSRVDGEPALTVAVTKVPDANTVDVSHQVRDALPDLEEALAGAGFTIVFDQAPYIEQSIESLATEGMLGLAFAVLVILVFLLSVRATIVTAISIPTSVLITFVGLQFADYSLNLLTLGGLTIAIGRIVDDSIVVIENIKRHLAMRDEAPGEQGKVRVIGRAVREVAGAVTASTLTTVTVFLPISFVEGATGELFRPFALTVTIALLASLVVSLTIVPVLAYWFLRAPKIHRHSGSPEAESDGRLQKAYRPILAFTLARPLVTLLVAALVLGGSVALLPLMKTNFLGSSGQNTLSVTQTFEPGTSLDVQDAAARQVEDELEQVDGVETVQATIGGGSSLLAAFGRGGGGSRAVYSITTDEGADQDAIQTDVRDRLDGLEEAGDISVQASAGFGTSSNIEVDITAPGQDELQAASDAILASVRDLDEVAEASSNLQAAQPFLQVQVNRAAAAAAGFTEVALAGFVSQAGLPASIGRITIDDDRYTIYLAAQDAPTSTAALAALPVPTAAGPVRLDTLAAVDVVNGPATITTVDGARTATVTVTPAEEDLTTANAAVLAALDGADLPAGASAELGGVSADQRDAFSQLGIALLVAILIVYIVMVATFRSLLQPFLLLISVPFAATGAILLQVLTGIPLGVPSIIGVLMLIGIVVTNAIVLVDLVNQYRRQGEPLRQALLDGATRRLRPILMTALATVFALLPMALGLTGEGGFISQPLALVVIGGLTSSTVLTLIVLPVLYYVVERVKEGAHARREARAVTRAG
ncbi:efflux RND transporter permease subunit [Naasia sp. SYSU D00057]|uniref:efflux RND transporter permease subunit n=1 Tax=Naasia sp. SYSU D00057 TaxID=2817380 RepID=UPI001B30D91F|nr:efflux RND transporter permease subunit [Naasia sp. SYSU D00057]